MVKKTIVLLVALAVVVMGAAMSWGYTVTQWPAPGIPNTVYFGGGQAVYPCDFMLKGPVAPGLEPALIPGAIHAGLSVPFRVVGMAGAALFTRTPFPTAQASCPLGDPAYVTAAVPATPVNTYTPPQGW